MNLPRIGRRSATQERSVPVTTGSLAALPSLLKKKEAPYEGSVVVVDHVARTYRLHGNDVYALKGINLTVPRGKMIALRGRSGSGKTTLLNLIGGLDRPTQGRVLIEGQDITKLSDSDMTVMRRRKIAFVFQAYALLPVLSAAENVDLAMRIAAIPYGLRTKRAQALLEIVGLGKRASHRPFELSGGEQQRVAIARALANEPTLILADEPTGELDSVTGLQVLKLFRRIVSEQGVTVIIATHDPTINEIADTTYHITDGVLETMD